MSEKGKDEKDAGGKDEKDYICPFCDKVYSTRSGLWKHIAKCPARPDSDEKDVDADKSGGEGFDLFGRDEPGQEEEDGYQCPQCRYVAKRPFDKCPKCGAELSWED